MKRVVCDIEANGLLNTLTKMWCAVTEDLDTGEIKVFSDYSDTIVDGGTDDFIAHLKTCDQVVGHNFIGYDKEAIRMITGYEMTADIIDTMLLSKLLHFTRYIPKSAGNGTRHSSLPGVVALRSLNQSRNSGRSGRRTCFTAVRKTSKST